MGTPNRHSAKIRAGIVFLAMAIPQMPVANFFPATRAGAPSADFRFPLFRIDRQQDYDRLKMKIDKEFELPREKAPLDEYLRWMGIKAADRDKAGVLSAEAQSAGNPYWKEKFLDLVELAQESGKSTVTGAVMSHVNIRIADGWMQAVHNAGVNGKPLFLRARELGLNSDVVREAVRCLMRYAIGYVEANEHNNTCLYINREVVHGTQFDEQGNLLIPNMNYSVDCLPRSAFHLQSEGDPGIDADVGLAWVQSIREVCRWFDLFEFNEATDLMEQYLMETDETWDMGGGIPMEVLCMLPRNKGHAFFLKLAEQYNLPRSKEHIEGFYAKLKGIVEYEDENGKRSPAPGAVVTVTDPHDGTEWITEADEDGRYEIEEVILHKTCGPFPITAEYQGYEEEDEYEGPLEKPNKDFEHEKNLLIRADAWEGSISGTWEMKAGQDESALAAIMKHGEYEAVKNWKLRLKFKRDRGNENVVIFGLDEARLEVFSENLDMVAMRMEREGRKIKMTGRDQAEARSRKLTPKECDLELAVNLKKKTYSLTGKVDVWDIAASGESRLDVKAKPIIVDEKEATEGVTGIKEEIDISGTFSDSKPVRFSGTRNEMESLPQEFQNFLKALAGKIEWRISWDLKKKKIDGS